MKTPVFDYQSSAVLSLLAEALETAEKDATESFRKDLLIFEAVFSEIEEALRRSSEEKLVHICPSCFLVGGVCEGEVRPVSSLEEMIGDLSDSEVWSSA